MIEVRGLTKRYGSTVAADRLSFDVAPGAVTGTPASAARPTVNFAGRCARPEDCWNPGPSTRAGLPARTWPHWRRATPSASPGSPRSWT